MQRITVAGALLACFLSVAGCGSPAPAGLKGKVTLDGTPVENGSIKFYPTNEGGTKDMTTTALRQLCSR